MRHEYTPALDAEAQMANPEDYERGQEEGYRIAIEGLGITGRKFRQDPEYAQRYIAMRRNTYSQPFPYAVKRRSYEFGILKGLELYQEESLGVAA